MLKTCKLTKKLAPAHKVVLERLAGLQDGSIAALVRRLIQAEAKRRGFWPGPTSLWPSISDEEQEQATYD